MTRRQKEPAHHHQYSHVSTYVLALCFSLYIFVVIQLLEPAYTFSYIDTDTGILS